MGLYYPNQTVVALIGSKNSANTISAIALTNAYQAESATVPTKSFAVGDMSRIEFMLKYTMGAAETSNTIEVKIDASNDLVNFYQIATDGTTGGTSTLTAREFTFVGANAAAAYLNFGLDIAYKYIRIAVKESGVSTNAGTIFVEGLLSGK